MTRSFLDSTDDGLRDFAVNFATRIIAAPTDYGLTAAEAAAFDVLCTNYVDALAVVRTPATRTKGAVAAKDDARTLLRRSAGMLSKKVQGTESVTAQQKIDLGLTVPDTEPTPVSRPATAPLVTVTPVSSHAFEVVLRNAENESSRARPAGVVQATIFTHAGEHPPADTDDWTFGLNVSRTKTIVHVKPSLAAGTIVWVTAFWSNRRSESGPASTPVSTRVQFSPSTMVS